MLKNDTTPIDAILQDKLQSNNVLIMKQMMIYKNICFITLPFLQSFPGIT